LYLIRAAIGKSAVTVAYALMTGKSEGDYEQLFRVLLKEATDRSIVLAPESFTSFTSLSFTEEKPNKQLV
jgi:hypothetical protein